ncbi:uncharacterized protein [Nicotiana tomentosiformis]|uniref:uncharacterized protein n=1 Tax=Nicotiana tomentosiformis TaxID=4098 RepID=UPI00388C6A1B
MEQLQQVGQEGFRFRPTDSEGLMFLLRFVAGQEMHDSGFITTNVDVYGKQEPWEIYDNGDNKGKPVHYKNMGNASSVVNIGSKTNLSYKNKEFYPEDQKDGHWLMKEYELSKVILHKFDQDCRDYVLCAIKKLKHVNSSSETSTITTFNNVSDRTDEELDDLNQILDGVPEVDVAVDIVEPLAAVLEPESNSAHVEHSNVADMSQMNLISFNQSVPEDVLGLDPWDIMDLDELKRMLEDVSECCPDGC